MSRWARLKRIGLLVGWMLLITYWSDQSSLPIDEPPVKWLLFNLQHRLAHLIAFGLVGLLAAYAFEGWTRRALLAIGLTSIFGASDEVHQAFVVGRRAGIDDWLFDTFFAALALYVWPRLQTRVPRLASLGPLLAATILLVSLVVTTMHVWRPPESPRASLRIISTQVISYAREVSRQVRAVRPG